MTAPRMALGSVRLKVRDTARAEAFYTTVLGLSVSERLGTHVFLTTGEAHHVLELEGVGIDPEGRDHVGLATVGWEVADAWEFWRMHRRLETAGVRFEALDHGIRWALTFNDPDGNALEIWVDSRTLPGGRAEWAGTTQRVDAAAILETLQAMIPGIVEVEG